MVDIHCHILPGLDDGPKNVDESLAMLRMASADGIRTIVGTPHFGDPYEEPPPELIRSLTERVNEVARAEELPIEVLPGCEARISQELPEKIDAGQALTLGDSGRYLLVELPPPPIPLYALDVHFRLRLAGVTPVLAHAERVVAVRPGWRFVGQFVEQGGLLQVNAGALAGEEGAVAQRHARRLFAKGRAHVIASDGHGTDKRRPTLSQCVSAFPRRERRTVLERYCQLDLGEPS